MEQLKGQTVNRDTLLAKYNTPIPLLGHGFVRLVDVMGDDHRIAEAARVSYSGSVGQDSDQKEKDRSLIRYLMRHAHTSPFEQCEIVLGLKMPIFVARQWLRHRTANVNEMSGRYRELPAEFYTPQSGEWRTQSTSNNQGSGGNLDTHEGNKLSIMYQADNIMVTSTYQTALAMGAAKEQARIGLPLSTFTELYWKIDLHNLLHFLSLRLDTHAQEEIRVYAQEISRIVADWVPLTWLAFRDYHPRMDGKTFSTWEQMWLAGLLCKNQVEGANMILEARSMMSPREISDFSDYIEALTEGEISEPPTF